MFQVNSSEDYDFDNVHGWDNTSVSGGDSTQQVNGLQLWFFSNYLKLDADQSLDYASCRDDTGYIEGGGYNDRRPFAQFVQGDRYCIRTHQGRIALETFTNVSETKLVAHVVVYQTSQ